MWCRCISRYVLTAYDGASRLSDNKYYGFDEIDERGH